MPGDDAEGESGEEGGRWKKAAIGAVAAAKMRKEKRNSMGEAEIVATSENKAARLRREMHDPEWRVSEGVWAGELTQR